MRVSWSPIQSYGRPTTITANTNSLSQIVFILVFAASEVTHYVDMNSLLVNIKLFASFRFKIRDSLSLIFGLRSDWLVIARAVSSELNDTMAFKTK